MLSIDRPTSAVTLSLHASLTAHGLPLVRWYITPTTHIMLIFLGVLPLILPPHRARWMTLTRSLPTLFPMAATITGRQTNQQQPISHTAT